jgi:hypothetical protein
MAWHDLMALVFATGTPINAWLYEESIVAVWREWIIAWGDHDGEMPGWRDNLRYTLAELLSCRFCMSHWVPVILILMFYVPSLFVSEPWSIIVKLPIYSLAATRGALCLGIIMRRLLHYSQDADVPGDNQE